MNIKRRTFLQGTGALGAVLLTGLGTGTAVGQQTAIRHAWWGNPERDRRTFEVIDIFNGKHSDLTVTGEPSGWDDYWTKLATQAAGRNMPDVIQHGLNISEYIERGLVLPLDEHIGDTLDLSGLDQSAVEAMTIDGKLWGISIGSNTLVSAYNRRLFEEAGLSDVDPILWNWDDIREISVAITESTPDGTFGMDDPSANWDTFRVYLGQRGIMDPYDADGNFAFDASVLADYWHLCKGLRDAGATPPGPESAARLAPSMSELNLVTGKTALSFGYSNQVVGMQGLMTDTIGVGMVPHLEGGQPGQWVQPSQCISLSRDAVDTKAATTYINAFVNDPEMTRVLGLERGIPAVSQVREALLDSLTETEQTIVSYFDAIQDHLRPLIPPLPPGALEAQEVFSRLVVNVLLDRQSIEDTAAQIVAEGNAILRRT